MTRPPTLPELLAPAGSLDAARAAVANGADAVYLGAERFNARDEGAQLTLDELADACAIAHGRGARVYLTLNTLVKPGELREALHFLGEAIDRGIDAAIVQDIGLVRLIAAVYPGFEMHGSTQMTVHDASGARVVRALGVDRVVLARENTLDDVRAIRAAVPEIGLETFVHGALCISYSGQCYMSGMISERSANRGSCAQSCRKDYTLRDTATGDVLDRGFLISARDLAAHDSLAELAAAGVGCLKIEGRKKRPEYVATVTRGYRDFLSRVARGEPARPDPDDVAPLVQIYSRGFTPGMYRGRHGREYVTRDHPDNRGVVLGQVAEVTARETIVDAVRAIAPGDGLAFEPPPGGDGETVGASVTAVRLLARAGGTQRLALTLRARPRAGWIVRRTADATLLTTARESFAGMPVPERRVALAVAAFGTAGAPLKLVFRSGEAEAVVRSSVPLAPAARRALDVAQLREQLGRLGGTPYALASVTADGVAAGLFLPVSELNRLRQEAVRMLDERRRWELLGRRGERDLRIDAAVAAVPAAAAPVRAGGAPPRVGAGFTLGAHVYTVDAARAAADAGATEIVLDPFLRHPPLPFARVRGLAASLDAAGVALRLRTPTIIRPAERRGVQRWLDLGLPVTSGHLGLVAELAGEGRDVVADYAVNCFNQHTAAELFRRGVARIVPSIELTVEELGEVVAPWRGAGFDVLLFGRPEGMTIEHCVLSAAFDRTPTTCRDLCVQRHRDVALTDPAGYTFPVATDSACRNRLLHSRPVEGSEYLPRLWRAGIRAYHAVFNVPGDDVAAIVRRYRALLDGVAGAAPDPAAAPLRELLRGGFTRGHFARAV